jgi:hypothetical protein
MAAAVGDKEVAEVSPEWMGKGWTCMAAGEETDMERRALSGQCVGAAWWVLERGGVCTGAGIWSWGKAVRKSSGNMV